MASAAMRSSSFSAPGWALSRSMFCAHSRLTAFGLRQMTAFGQRPLGRFGNNGLWRGCNPILEWR